MAVTKRPKARAPPACVVPKPSTTDNDTQSFADPSVRAAAKTIRPIIRVRGSSQPANAPGRDATGAAPPAPGTGAAPSACRTGAVPSASSTGAGIAAPCGRGPGRKARTAHTTATVDATITIVRWASTEAWTAAATAPMPAPIIVPTEKPAWNRGMIDRPRRCSTATPARFIAASHTPVPTPNRTSPATTSAMVPSAEPSDAVSSPIAHSTAKLITVRRAPMRSTTTPESGRDTSEPIAPTSSSRPTCAGSRPRESRTAGRRDAQLAKSTPLSRKTTNTATPARRTMRSFDSPPPRPSRSLLSTLPPSQTRSLRDTPARAPAGRGAAREDARRMPWPHLVEVAGQRRPVARRRVPR
ncbi:hypothetical protein GALL_452910 [mine drainage metagenome]|uniref:Uncharacterized protein n=1 Tax=mine drainage metagenome TaxID=410659 RepID=A0A1J5PZP5_9ZZZZ